MSEHSNAIADQYRHRIFWIQDRLQEMADVKGQILKSDAEQMIFSRYSCSPTAVQRYLKTLQGKRFIEVNDTHLILPHLRDRDKEKAKEK